MQFATLTDIIYKTFTDHAGIAREGGEVARNARIELEQKTGRNVISPLNAKTGIALQNPDNNKEEEEEQQQ